MAQAHTDVYQLVTDKIIAALEAGTPPWIRPWQGPIDPLPTNAESKQVYRGVNFLTLQIEAQHHGYARNLWLTYNQAATRGAQVRKGEKWHAGGVLENAKVHRQIRRAGPRQGDEHPLHPLQRGIQRVPD